jgi:LytS/YehU family sensor histidine kinase
MIAVSIQDTQHNPDISWWEPLLWEGSSAVAATCWMLAVRRSRDYHAQYLDQPLRWFGYHLRWLPLVAVTFISAVYAVRHGVYGLVGRTYNHAPWSFVFVYESIKLVLFAGLWLGIVFGLDSYAQWQAQRRRLLELQKTLAEAQLAQLKAQLRPHFFFNALNTISALMHVDVARADRLLARLADLLRVSLQSGEQEMTSLRDELHSLDLYAQIMQERFADRVTLAWRVDDSALEAFVPSLLLQPLLENAFKHGVERSIGPVKIEVTAQREGDSLRLAVSNSGSTLAVGYREGIGLRNCRERLNVIYGGKASLQLSAEADSVVATIVMPLHEKSA